MSEKEFLESLRGEPVSITEFSGGWVLVWTEAGTTDLVVRQTDGFLLYADVPTPAFAHDLNDLSERLRA